MRHGNEKGAEAEVRAIMIARFSQRPNAMKKENGNPEEEMNQKREIFVGERMKGERSWAEAVPLPKYM